MEDNKDAKVLFYISKLIYPKYNPFWFNFYMYYVYFRTIKRKLTYKLQPAPDKFISSYLRTRTSYFNDINNTIIVNEQNLYVGDRLLKLFSAKNKIHRIVYVAPSSKCDKDTLIASETCYYNLENSGFMYPVELLNLRENCIEFAAEIDISLINSPHDINNFVIDSIVQDYFRTPKLLNKGDIIEVNIKYFAQDLFFLNNKINNVDNVYFKCNKIIFNNEEVENSYFCVIGETTIKQSANIQCFVPQKKTKMVNNFNLLDFGEVPLCPYGLQTYLESIEKATRPLIKKNKLKLKPTFLLQGNKGSGKEILVSSLALRLGMHFYKINNSELLANVYVQTETKLRNAFFNAKISAPCIVSIHNFENFGRNNEGQYDERIIGYFADELKTLFENNNFPVILFCCTNVKDIPSSLKKLFLETFEIHAPNSSKREQTLKWILEERSVTANINLNDIANKTHGFLFEDLKALVYYAEIDSKKFSNADRNILAQENFMTALDYMQANYNESIGAPKVPKVQWADIGGLGEVKEEIIKTINLPLKHPQFLKKSGLNRSGILLFGPPGTGKTLIAKAVATECSLCFLSVKGPELLNMYVGQSEQNVRDVFERARQASPCIIFFDELDALAPNRGMSSDSGGVMDRVVSQLLAEMDGLNESATVFIIGATNRPDLIDPALLRPGRFDKLLYVGPCTDVPSKIAVLRALTRKFKLHSDVDLSEVVQICPANITGADFYGVCASAWTSAVRKLITTIQSGSQDANYEDVLVRFEDFRTAIDNVKPSISPEDLRYFEKLNKQLSTNT